ncbi:MAG: ribonuclease HII [Solobacterium sp.]|nr:ribonuclease HII [Solobacterium sp.]
MKVKKICANDFEHESWQKDALVLGIDEAGRGPLAGPLVAAGVIFPADYENPEIYDSKAISEKKRELLFDEIMNDALYFSIVIVSPSEIDRYNIYRADQLAFASIAESLPADQVLTDAMPLELEKRVIPLVKGDQKSISIAAGSILAKVTRDRIMKEYDAVWPQYGFAKNKGYPTKQHLEALERYGITEIHRKSFGPVAAQQLKLDLFGDS